MGETVMVMLHGRKFTRRELMKRVGDVSQVGGIRPCELSDGNEKGVSALDVATGTGFAFTVLPNRGMDISSASYCGQSLCWRSSTGDVAAAYYDARGIQWLRSFYGGLLTTCGMTAAGSPSVDQGEELGLHGRIAHIPAKQVCVESGWKGDEYVMRIAGKVRETRVFGENLCMTRTVTTRLGENRLFIHDEVENLGFVRSPLMMLYHINGGYPAVDGSSELVTGLKGVLPRDDEALNEFSKHTQFLPPTPSFKERVYYLDLATDRKGMAHVALVNRRFGKGQGFGFYVTYPKAQLPMMVEWKMNGEGTYVVGIEPSNCRVEGRAKVRESGKLAFIEPGAVRKFDLGIGVLTGRADIAAFDRKVKSLR